MPALMFLQDEAEATRLPRGSRWDVELLLALAATALLACAAAEPSLRQRRPLRVVRLAVDVRATRPDARAFARRVLAVREEVARALDAADRLDLVSVPDAHDAADARRPPPERLVAAARAGEASVRIVVSDEAPPAETGGVHWVAVGDPGIVNQGIVAVAVDVEGQTAHVSCTVVNHAPTGVRLRPRLEYVGAGGPVTRRGPVRTVAPEGLRAWTLDVPVHVARFHVRLAREDDLPLDDAMPQDDAVLLRRGLLPVFVDPALPPTHRRHIALGVRAVLGTGGARFLAGAEAGRAELAFVRQGTPVAASAAWSLAIAPVREGAPAERAGDGAEGQGQGDLADDLSTASADWIYAGGAATVGPGERVLLGRRGARRLWPILLQQGRHVRLAPDPARGSPAAFDSPFWPLLVANLVRVTAGRGVGGGYRAEGVLDPATSRPGRARASFEANWIRSAPPSVPGRSRPLRPWLIVGALACLILLWLAPRLRIRALPAPAA